MVMAVVALLINKSCPCETMVIHISKTVRRYKGRLIFISLNWLSSAESSLKCFLMDIFVLLNFFHYFFLKTEKNVKRIGKSIGNLKLKTDTSISVLN